jgi:hypothetical protein
MRISAAKQLLKQVFTYNLEQAEKGAGENTYIVPFFVGDPGVGKTAIPRQVAREMTEQLAVRDKDGNILADQSIAVNYYQAIIAQYDAGELAGLPMMDAKNENMIRLRPNYLPPVLAADGSAEIGIFNLDELPQAFLANQNIASQMVNEYRVGEHRISPAITICCTGNKPENKAGTTAMPTHLRDRLMFIEIEANLDDFLNYAAERRISPFIRAFLRENPKFLSQFDAGSNANPTPRSWEKVSAIVSMDLDPHIRREAIKGQIGEAATTTFDAYFKVQEKMPKIADILKDPEKVPVFGNKNADILYLLIANLADIADDKNVGQIIKYVNRIEAQEFSVACLIDMVRRDPKLNQHPAVTKWKLGRGLELMA